MKTATQNQTVKKQTQKSTVKKPQLNKKQNDEIIALMGIIVEQNTRLMQWQSTIYSAAKEVEDQLRNLNSKVERLIILTDADRHDSWTNQTKRAIRKLRFW